MKRLSIILLISAGLVMWSSTLFSQNTLKIGHLNVNEIVASLPERDSAALILDRETKDYESLYEEMQVEYNNLVELYQKNLSTYSELLRRTKESELVDKQRRIQDFEQMASTTLQQRNQELIQPIFDKVLKAIDKVATENQYTYILDTSRGGVVYISKESNDISAMVLAIVK